MLHYLNSTQQLEAEWPLRLRRHYLATLPWTFGPWRRSHFPRASPRNLQPKERRLLARKIKAKLNKAWQKASALCYSS